MIRDYWWLLLAMLMVDTERRIRRLECRHD